jgi:hypothetical protein
LPLIFRIGIDENVKGKEGEGIRRRQAAFFIFRDQIVDYLVIIGTSATTSQSALARLLIRDKLARR